MLWRAEGSKSRRQLPGGRKLERMGQFYDNSPKGTGGITARNA